MHFKRRRKTFGAAWPGLGHHGGGLVQQLGLMVRVEGSGVSHVVQNVTAYQPVPANAERTREVPPTAPPSVHLELGYETTVESLRTEDKSADSPLSHCEESLWSEGSLCVNVHGFAFSSPLINGQLWTEKTRLCHIILHSWCNIPVACVLVFSTLRWSLHSKTGLYLTGNSECVAQLGLPRPKLPKHLRDGAGLDPACRRNK